METRVLVEKQAHKAQSLESNLEPCVQTKPQRAPCDHLLGLDSFKYLQFSLRRFEKGISPSNHPPLSLDGVHLFPCWNN